MSRLNIERQKELEPKRMDRALLELFNHPLVSDIVSSDKLIEFLFKDEIVRYYPYSGWATGKSIKDGRGIENLLKQLKQTV